MGAGKSTLLGNLAAGSSAGEYRFFDLDDEVFLQYGDSFSDLAGLIGYVGMAKFREYELLLLKSLILSEENVVVALGGGALENQKMAAFLATAGCSVFLDTPMELCLHRILSHKSEQSKRPLAQKGKKFLVDLYHARRADYLKCQIRIESDQIDLSQLVTWGNHH